MLEVVAALIRDNENRILICQRPKNKARGLLWEFVGGKVESGETKEDAIIRECKEELNVTLCVERVFTQVTHEYSDVTVHLTLFEARIIKGEIEKIEHNDIKWVTEDELRGYDFCPADVQIINEILSSDG